MDTKATTETTTTPQDSNVQKNSLVGAATESRFNSANFSEALTAFSCGYKDPEDLAGLLEFIAPAVPVARRFEFKKAKNAEAFLSETNDVRAIGSAFKRIEYTGETVNEKTYNKGLTIRIDHDEVISDDWQERYVQLLIQRLYRNELRRAVIVLDNAAKASQVTWSDQSNPDSDLRKMLSTATDESGLRPNRILIGEGAWDARINAYESKENPIFLRSADAGPSELARKLLVEDIRVIRARYQTGPREKGQILGNTIYAYFARPDITKDEPSNLKRFVTPVGTGTPFRVYVEEQAKYTDLTVEHYSNIVITSDLGIQKYTIEQ